MSKKLVLVDGMAMVYRAYFALISRPLINKKGKNTSAVYGFVNSLVKVLEDEKPEYAAVCFDTEKPTFRHEQFPQYKAQRMEIPTDMPWQIKMVKEVVKAFNIPLLEIHGYEADDIIGTLAKRAEKQGIAIHVNQIGSLMSAFFTGENVKDYAGATSSDTKAYADYFNYMLENGIYVAPSQFEAMFISAAHSDEDIQRTIDVLTK